MSTWHGSEYDSDYSAQFDPVGKPMAVPSAAIFDSPATAVLINAEWRGHIYGALERLLWGDAWQGDDVAKDAAIQQILELIIGIGQGVKVPSDYQLIGAAGVGGSPGLLQILNLPATHRHLEIVGRVRTSRPAVAYEGVGLVVNGDMTTTHYASKYTQVDGLGTHTTAANLGTVAWLNMAVAVTVAGLPFDFSAFRVLIPEYADFTPHEFTGSSELRIGAGAANLWTAQAAGHWAVFSGVNPGNQIQSLQLVGATQLNFEPGSSMLAFGVGLL